MHGLVGSWPNTRKGGGAPPGPHRHCCGPSKSIRKRSCALSDCVRPAETAPRGSKAYSAFTKRCGSTPSSGRPSFVIRGMRYSSCSRCVTSRSKICHATRAAGSGSRRRIRHRCSGGGRASQRYGARNGLTTRSRSSSTLPSCISSDQSVSQSACSAEAAIVAP